MSDFMQEVNNLPIVDVAVSSLALGLSPRVAGHDERNVRILAGLDQPWPPILVQSRTNRVIDGTHRLLAARMRGDETITARLHDCDDSEALVLAVSSNVSHGLPLSLSDRRAAARRIIEVWPEWSDRRIAAATGLSGKTVGVIRRDGPPQPERLGRRRLGSDGRSRPVDLASRRAMVTQLLDEHPDSSLRDIAERAGVSPETVRTVRAGIRGGATTPPPAVAARRPAEPDPKRCLKILLRDPALRSTDPGRLLLRVLSTLALLEDLASLVEVVPEHDLSAFEELASFNAATLRSLAKLAGGRRREGAREPKRARATA